MLDLSRAPARPLVGASILAADFGHMAQECRDVLDRGADLLHLDVMDGHFVPNLTMGADMIRALRHHFPQTYLDVHLMVERPDQFVDMFADAGANCFTFHLEVTRPTRATGIDPVKVIDAVRQRGMAAGMAVNPDTPVQGLARLLDRLDLVLIMSVHPGRAGQKFIPEVLDKVRWARTRIGVRTRLEIDGGINPQTAPAAAAAGCDILVTASALFGAPARGEVIRQLHGARGR